MELSVARKRLARLVLLRLVLLLLRRCAMQDQIEQEWACAAAHAASLAGGTAAAVRAPSATALRSCLGALEQVRAHLHAIDTMQRSLQGGGAGGGSERRGAEEPEDRGIVGGGGGDRA